jgi:uncharacterized membrane protein
LPRRSAAGSLPAPVAQGTGALRTDHSPMTPEHPPARRRRSLGAGLRTSFLTGLAVVLPIVLTVWLVATMVRWLDERVLPLIPAAWQPEALLRQLFGPDFAFSPPGAGLVVFLVFTVVVGWIAKGLIGRSVLRSAEALVDRMPVVRSVYTGIKQIAESVLVQSGQSFERACLVRFPHADLWAVGLVAPPPSGEIAARLPGGERMLTVFVATALVPPAGFVVFAPERDVIPLDMSLEEAAKLILSAGLVQPAPRPDTPPGPRPGAGGPQP